MPWFRLIRLAKLSSFWAAEMGEIGNFLNDGTDCQFLQFERNFALARVVNYLPPNESVRHVSQRSIAPRIAVRKIDVAFFYKGVVVQSLAKDERQYTTVRSNGTSLLTALSDLSHTLALPPPLPVFCNQSCLQGQEICALPPSLSPPHGESVRVSIPVMTPLRSLSS